MKPWPATDDPHPEFALEALEGAEPGARRELLEAVNRLPDALVTAAGVPAALRARLLEETSRAPERYAPFTPRLSELYDLPRDEIRQLLQRSADPRAWRASGLPGIRKLPVQAGAGRVGAQAYLVTFVAGARFPVHHHDGHETVLLLAGSYIEDTGKVYATGDVHSMAPGSGHSFTIAEDEDCVAAALLYGRLNFQSLPLRLLARLLGH
jgi:quercetin dioxygenase-like cupin family protein